MEGLEMSEVVVSEVESAEKHALIVLIVEGLIARYPDDDALIALHRFLLDI